MAASSSRGGGGDDNEPYLLGFLVTKIVGLKHYKGIVSGREKVTLVREPLNQYDDNAIAVHNRRGVKVGHIEKPIAGVLAPLLDSLLIPDAVGIVPKVPSSKHGGKPFKLVCQVHIFARPAAADIVKEAIKDKGLALIYPRHAEFSLSESAFVQEETKRSDQDVDKLFALVGKDGDCKIEPMDAPGDVVLSALFEHQKEALGWLVHREESCDLPPFWEEDTDGGYKNVLTCQDTKERPAPLRGGIFADDMGLGKTLTLLSLIARSKAPNVGGKKAKGAKRRKIDDDAEEASRTTLVVCPPSVFSSWVTQLEEHTKAGSLKVYMYHGERTNDKKVLLKYDIVITTYSILGMEFGQEGSPVKDIEWFRVILDEAHVIKNSKALQTQAVTALNAQRRWVVTGTPIQNSSLDLFPLMAFLKFEPFSIKSYWLSLIQQPLGKGDKAGLSRLQNLLGAISLRRIKDTESGSKSVIALPPKTVVACYIELSAEEREFYDQMELEGRNKMLEFGDRDLISRNYSTVLFFILRLRQLCNDVALCPLDMKSWFPTSSIEVDVANNPELLKKLASLVDDGEDFDCPICLSPPSKTVITSCSHIYCQTCILKILKSSSSCCPICRRSLSKEDLFIAPKIQHPDEDGLGSLGSDKPLSSKVQALLELLKRSQKEDPTSKSVVFSQFRKMLLLLEGPLKRAGFNILRLDGSMNPKKRSDVIKQFAAIGPDAPTVLLASLKAAGAGVNLTAASTVYLFDPWWNPGVEEQAMDRVHRIGQTRPVKAVRLIVKGSIEERVLELQERKKRLISGAFGRNGGAKEKKELRLEELRMMMGL